MRAGIYSAAASAAAKWARNIADIIAANPGLPPVTQEAAAAMVVLTAAVATPAAVVEVAALVAMAATAAATGSIGSVGGVGGRYFSFPSLLLLR